MKLHAQCLLRKVHGFLRYTAKIPSSAANPSQTQQPSILLNALRNRMVLHVLFSRGVLWAVSIFITLCVLVGFNATHSVDQRLFVFANAVVSEPFDLAASFVTLLGNFEVTGVFTLAISILGWLRRGIRGLTPMLLFFGVAIEIVLKFFLPHPGLPEGYGRNVEFLPPLPFATPYSFPSGHMLRTTFLVTYCSANRGPGRIFGWLLVLAMALTRLYLNEHWTSDVVGGVFLGLTLAYAARAIDEYETPTKN